IPTNQFRTTIPMKKHLCILALLSAALASQASVITLQLSPAGTGQALGLSPANVVPAVSNSFGSGNTISGGITLDTTTSNLTFVIGYGSSAGFTDLTGPATGLFLHGPAATNATAPILLDLAPYHLPAANPAKGGLIFGTVVADAVQY